MGIGETTTTLVATLSRELTGSDRFGGTIGISDGSRVSSYSLVNGIIQGQEVGSTIGSYTVVGNTLTITLETASNIYSLSVSA